MVVAGGGHVKYHRSDEAERVVKCVVILVAMEQEASPMIKEFNLVIQDSICEVSQCQLYSGEFSGCALHLVSRIGT